ncbi:hypothetical protein [Psychromicrobium lacuslunae]|uniref:Uncharacterized protein n=1 Tax=Psychromicrobium lacuslunae TaxID=1618207 RepID=A0A0D4C0Q1_9MICC|nr:hypothetical protein [Psychromicrobium lacuslunae]AJT42119.1 hypothetical protein UM93_12485 [Psychromicrobium lacuslunae]
MTIIDEDNARQMTGGLLQVAEIELINALKQNRNAAPIVRLNDFENRIIDPGLDQAQLLSLVPQGFDAILAYVIEHLRPRRAEFSCFLVVVEPMDDAAQSSAVVRAEHLLGNSLQCRATFNRKKMLSAPKIVGEIEGMETAPLLWDDNDRRAYFEQGRQFIGLPPHAGEDFNALHDSLLSIAKTHIEKNGEFFPFGQTIDLSGQQNLSMVAEETEESSQLVELIAAGQRQERDQLRAAGIASEVYVRQSADSDPVPAIAVDVELSSGPSFRTFTRWQRDAANGTVRFLETAAQPPQPRVWA